MKHLLLAALVAFTCTASAQITLEKSYSGYGTVTVHNIENEGHKYMVVDSKNMKVYLFNDNHTLWKTIIPQLPPKTYGLTAYYPSTLLFNSDNSVEIVVSYIDTSNGITNYTYQTAVLHENGTKIIGIPDCWYPTVAKVSGSWKLIASKMLNGVATYSDVYSLPGQMLGVQKPGRPDGEFETSAYPNPAETTAAISYTLPAGVAAATVQLFNSNGVMLQSYPVSQNSGVILIDRSGYPAGMYHYTINAGGVKQSNNLIFH